MSSMISRFSPKIVNPYMWHQLANSTIFKHTISLLFFLFPRRAWHKRRMDWSLEVFDDVLPTPGQELAMSKFKVGNCAWLMLMAPRCGVMSSATTSLTVIVRRHRLHFTSKSQQHRRCEDLPAHAASGICSKKISFVYPWNRLGDLIISYYISLYEYLWICQNGYNRIYHAYFLWVYRWLSSRKYQGYTLRIVSHAYAALSFFIQKSRHFSIYPAIIQVVYPSTSVQFFLLFPIFLSICLSFYISFHLSR